MWRWTLKAIDIDLAHASHLILPDSATLDVGSVDLQTICRFIATPEVRERMPVDPRVYRTLTSRPQRARALTDRERARLTSFHAFIVPPSGLATSGDVSLLFAVTGWRSAGTFYDAHEVVADWIVGSRQRPAGAPTSP